MKIKRESGNSCNLSSNELDEEELTEGGLEEELRQQGLLSSFIDFDDELFEGKKNRSQIVFDIISQCLKYGYPKGNVFYDSIEIVMADHQITCQHVKDEVAKLNAKCIPLQG